jgi:hypothetical protein
MILSSSVSSPSPCTAHQSLHQVHAQPIRFQIQSSWIRVHQIMRLGQTWVFLYFKLVGHHYKLDVCARALSYLLLIDHAPSSRLVVQKKKRPHSQLKIACWVALNQFQLTKLNHQFLAQPQLCPLLVFFYLLVFFVSFIFYRKSKEKRSNYLNPIHTKVTMYNMN